MRCEHCGKPYATQDGLYRHVRGKHAEALAARLPDVETVNELLRRRAAADFTRREEAAALSALFGVAQE